MPFSHDVEEALLSAADLVNTGARGAENLETAEQVDELAERHDFSVRSDGSAAQLRRLRRLRDRFRQLWQLAAGEENSAEVRDEVVEWVNAAIDDSRAVPQLTRHDGWDWHLHYTPLGSPIEQQILAEAAMAVVALFREGELGRMKQCAGDDCDAVLIDLSRNRSRRFCDVGNCGNRANVAAYRARQREQDS